MCTHRCVCVGVCVAECVHVGECTEIAESVMFSEKRGEGQLTEQVAGGWDNSGV